MFIDIFWEKDEPSNPYWKGNISIEVFRFNVKCCLRDMVARKAVSDALCRERLLEYQAWVLYHAEALQQDIPF